MKHITTNHDLVRFRLCAGVGMTIAETARRCGVSAGLVRRWEQRLELRFARKHHRTHRRVDPMAEDKLRALLAQLRVPSREGLTRPR